MLGPVPVSMELPGARRAHHRGRKLTRQYGHPGAGRDLSLSWVPAFAGMTRRRGMAFLRKTRNMPARSAEISWLGCRWLLPVGLVTGLALALSVPAAAQT